MSPSLAACRTKGDNGCMNEVSVILVLEQPEQTTGSGCCGKLGGDAGEICGPEVFSEAKALREQFGILHRAVRQLFPQERVSVVTVDPRNQLYLVPKLWRDVFRYRPGVRASMTTTLQLFSLPAVLVNGRVVSSRGAPVDPDELCHLIHEALDSPIETQATTSNAADGQS